MNQVALPIDGFCCGPLFAPIVKVRENPRKYISGGAEVWAKYRRARPSWADPAALSAFWVRSREMTAATGIQHSVDHTVPLIHKYVCGLHVENNLRIIPLADNIRKSNNHWPDMWAEQGELF